MEARTPIPTGLGPPHLAALGARGPFRSRDAEACGVSREQLRRLVRSGAIVRVSRGLYVLPDVAPTRHRTLAEVGRRVPRGIVCLLSALQFHGLTTQAPFQVWLAVGRTAWRPRSGDLPLRVVRFSGAGLTEGVETHEVEGVSIRVTSPARTVCDCFAYRNKIGLDVALEALREGWRARRFTMDEVWRLAKVRRVANVMRPYLESLVS